MKIEDARLIGLKWSVRQGWSSLSGVANVEDASNYRAVATFVYFSCMDLRIAGFGRFDRTRPIKILG